MATHSSILAWKIPCTEEPGSPWGCKESDTTEHVRVPVHTYTRVRACAHTHTHTFKSSSIICCSTSHVGSYFFDQGSNLCLLHRKAES